MARRNRRSARRTGNGQLTSQGPSVNLVSLRQQRTRIVWVPDHTNAGEYEYTLTHPGSCPPIQHITHVKWEMDSSKEVTWTPPNVSRSRFANIFTSQWIAVSDWEDITLHTIAGMYIPALVDSEGQETQPASWLPPVSHIVWHFRGIVD